MRGVLALAGLDYELMGKKNQVFDGVIVQDLTSYEFYANAKDCNYRGAPYVLLPDPRFHEIVVTHMDAKDFEREPMDRLLHGVWRAKINGDLSHVGWFSYRKTYWREPQ